MSLTASVLMDAVLLTLAEADGPVHTASDEFCDAVLRRAGIDPGKIGDRRFARRRVGFALRNQRPAYARQGYVVRVGRAMHTLSDAGRERVRELLHEPEGTEVVEALKTRPRLLAQVRYLLGEGR